jgi:hypothetical protein
MTNKDGADWVSPGWDFQYVEDLLYGKIGSDDNGKAVREYLSGEEERAALAALARVLRKGFLHENYRLTLADLFDPDIQEGLNCQPRRLAFVSRNPRGRKGANLEPDIALTLAEALGKGLQLKQAIAVAMKKFGVSERTITRAWAKFMSDPVIEAIRTSRDSEPT